MALIAYHKLMYENICGYSLGHTTTFFNSLPDAEKHYFDAPCITIIEFDINEDGAITNISHLHLHKISCN